MKHRDELALLETLDMGKPIASSAGGDIPASAQAIQWYGEAADIFGLDYLGARLSRAGRKAAALSPA